MGKYFSRGKLLLTSEYAVLDGALALAIPTKLGQEFSFLELPDQKFIIEWHAKHLGKNWLQIKIDYKDWKILETNIDDSSEFILKTLKNLFALNPNRFDGTSYNVETNLQFPPDYGLGSSSTLMNNLADWGNADAFKLNDLSLGGSGYDIAVAKKNSPIFFQINNSIRQFHSVDFNPIFKDQLIFIHLNQKQDSREGIRLYKAKPKSDSLINQLTEITENIYKCTDIEEFSRLMEKHEELISIFLNIKTIKEESFADCPVFIKSLGAWGGDFVLTRKFRGYKNYFFERNYTHIITYSDLIY